MTHPEPLITDDCELPDILRDMPAEQFVTLPGLPEWYDLAFRRIIEVEERAAAVLTLDKTATEADPTLITDSPTARDALVTYAHGIVSCVDSLVELVEQYDVDDLEPHGVRRVMFAMSDTMARINELQRDLEVKYLNHLLSPEGGEA